MIAAVYRLLMPAIFQDAADERRFRILLPASVWMIFTCLGFLLPLWGFGVEGNRFLILGTGFILLGLSILALLRFGQSRMGGYLAIVALLATANLPSLRGNGIYDTIYMLNILAVVSAGVLFGRGTVIFTALMAAGLSLFVAWYTGEAGLAEGRHPGPILEWFRRLSYLFITVVLYWLGWRATRRALFDSDQAKSENRSLARSLNTIMEQGNVGQYYWSYTSGKVYWSANVARILGIDQKQFDGSLQGFLNLVVEEDRPFIQSALESALHNPQHSYKVQYRVRRQDGSIHWMESRGNARYEDGRAVEMAGVVVDISEQKQAESALDRVYSILAEGIVIHNSDDAIVSFNRSALEILGLSGDQLQGKTTMDPLWKLVDENGAAVSPEQMPSAISMRTGEPQYGRVLGVHRQDGTLRWISVSSIPFSNDQSQARGAVVSFFDITATKNQARQLMKNEEQLRFILENQPGIVLLLDLDGIILYMNRVIRGYSKEDILNQSALLFIPEDDRSMFLASLERIKREGEPFSFDIRGYDAYGNISWFSTRIGMLEFHEQRRIIMIATDITDRVEAEQKLRNMAYTDLLTGLPNREALYTHLRSIVEDGAGAEKMYAILFVDLDHFKNINDTLGHDVGDQLLNQVATRFQNQLSHRAFLARLGGDEFMMVYEVNEKEEAEIHASGILNLFRGPIQVQGHDLYLSASIGLCFFPGDGEDIHQLIKNADAAMYRAKARGRNIYCKFEPEMESEIQARLLMDTELRGAATNGELDLHYQPVFDLRTETIVGVEALLRWENANLGPVSPGVFIPLAEETGAIRELDLWTMRSGIEQLGRWRRTGIFQGRMALNMSARQLENQDFVPEIVRLLKENGLSGKDISLELTETALMKNITAMTPLLHTMGEMGIELMIDDFGTGYSSLNYLKRLPVHVVKIDRSFVEEIGSEESDSIVRTIIAMARTLDLRVVAEGVENESQLAFLKQQGCDLTQGFYMARPAPAEEVEKLLGRTRSPRQ